ncbi:hypothetical protein RI129_003089 [Pyrocoelia pectoralis]|uniref:Uncharacterized protein n=1 Tax=Pyrocoelia pectoralis TaxID=417401 RepID=A0AAN7ZMF5_9COLE
MDKTFNKRTYFSTEDDLMILREVLGQNPYEDSNRWNFIHLNILQITGKSITTRALQDRVKILVNQYLNKEKKQQIKSSTRTSIKQSSINYLTKKNERWFEIRSRQLVLQERQQTLLEKKCEAEHVEKIRKLEIKEKRLQMDEMKLKTQLEIFSNQQKLLGLAFQKHN